jgi:hypothetical protein
MTQIVGISGKKQSGKTTSGNFIASIFMSSLNISQKININDSGEIVISDLFNNKNYAGVFDLSRTDLRTDYLINKAFSLLDPNIKLYSFADPLKQDICINIFGLTWEQCYGSDDQKNTPTALVWENMPGYSGELSGIMTARQVMEYVGTGIFRVIKKDSWVSATLKRIEKDNPKIAVITDCRFPDEVQSIKEKRGKVIRLSKSKFITDYESEIVLDEDKYDWSNFDFVIRNDDMTIYDQCMELQKVLEEIISL